MFGVFNLFKPSGMTSRAALDHLMRRLPKGVKAGHAGTLDPLANGVLVVCVGPATRLISRIQDLPKQYVGTFRAGYRADSMDCEGDYQPVQSVTKLSAPSIGEVLPRFRGVIDQVPPVYSAVKVNGRRAYDLARQGKSVELAARQVEIRKLELLRFEDQPQVLNRANGPIAGEEFCLEIECGSGTYVRSLGRDIAVALGSDAIMIGLERTGIGPMRSAGALRLESLDANALDSEIQNPLDVIDLPKLELSVSEQEGLKFGNAFEAKTRFEPGTELMGYDREQNLWAILEVREDRTGQQKLHPVVNFANYMLSAVRRRT